jgi:integrase
MVALTFLRADELAGLKWTEVDLRQKLLTIEGPRMKMRREHLVPLSKQSLAIIKQQKEISFDSEYVFPSPRSNQGHVSTQSLLKALRKQGVKEEDFTNHGWRHAASTTLHEKDFNSDWIEVQMAHVTPSTKGVYNKAKYLAGRRKMMQWWANFLDNK